jgi:hypothetical protein
MVPDGDHEIIIPVAVDISNAFDIDNLLGCGFSGNSTYQIEAVLTKNYIGIKNQEQKKVNFN